jgi:hypothetical protein
MALLFLGCNPLYQSYHFTYPVQTTLPVQAARDEIWVTSVPAGADVYVQPYNPDQIPSHATDPTAHRGKTPLRLELPAGSYWLEFALNAEVFDKFFSPPYDDAQFEQDGAASEALFFRPFTPGERRRVLRYYRVEKQPDQGQTLVALFHPRGAPAERAALLYPLREEYQIAQDELLGLLQQVQLPPDAQETFAILLRRGGKAFWSKREEFSFSLEVQDDNVEGHIIALYTGPPRPDPFLPDGGGF